MLKINAILGSVIGDIIGSSYEWKRTKNYNFEIFTPQAKFTDDTVLTIAIANAILNDESYTNNLIKFTNTYQNCNYGPGYLDWVKTQKPKPSYGNGSAMRISSIGVHFNTHEEVFVEAKKAVEMSHYHPEGIKGAQAIAIAIFMAKNGYSKNEIKTKISAMFMYNLDFTINQIRPNYDFYPTCQQSVPEAILLF